MKFEVRLEELMEHVVLIEANNEVEAKQRVYEVVMNENPEEAFGDDYYFQSLGTNNLFVEEVRL